MLLQTVLALAAGMIHELGLSDADENKLIALSVDDYVDAGTKVNTSSRKNNAAFIYFHPPLYLLAKKFLIM